ncbi:hypothetical protein MB46_10305 [Arthrobacter alpinus]|nr:hypothetical protein MB46_10305 [Arthrobacter alpinus]
MSPGAKHKELLALNPAPLRHASAAFPIKTKTWIAKDRAYPRAAVRLQPDGKWLLQLWYTPTMVRMDKEPLTYSSRLAAVLSGQIQVHADRSRKHPAGQLHLRGVSGLWAV